MEKLYLIIDEIDKKELLAAGTAEEVLKDWDYLKKKRYDYFYYGFDREVQDLYGALVDVEIKKIDELRNLFTSFGEKLANHEGLKSYLKTRNLSSKCSQWHWGVQVVEVDWHDLCIFKNYFDEFDESILSFRVKDYSPSLTIYVKGISEEEFLEKGLSDTASLIELKTPNGYRYYS